MAVREFPGPLNGVRIVDWTIFGVGPFTTSLLASLGADVIKVEQAPRGDPQQFIPPNVNGLAAFYINYNSGKRSVHLDLNQPADLERMWRLVESAEVMVTNFRAGTAEKFGFGQTDVLARNPDLVYLQSNGWGEVGPMRLDSGADNQCQAFCAWTSINGVEGGRGEFLRFLGHIDMNSSIYNVAAVLTGLAGRRRLGGQAIRLSMLEAAVAMQSSRFSEYLAGGITPRPLGSASAVVAPSQAFLCQDRAYVAVSAETQAQWERLCEALGRPDLLTDERFTTNADRVQHRHELARDLGSVFLTKPVAWWLIRLARERVPVSSFWDWDQLHEHGQVLANQHIVKIDTVRSGVLHTNGIPWKFEEAPGEIRRNPFTGEHTEEVFAELDGGMARPRRPAPDKDGLAPFAGLHVVELASGLAGPHAGCYLADQGAEVTKVEFGDGDYLRQWGPPFVDGVGTAFLELNRNKRVLLDPDPERLAQLVREADVIIVDGVDTDGRPPPVDGQEARRANPALVWCEITPYGRSGPLAGMPGSELTVQAMSNCWGGLGEIGQPPLRIGADECSMSAGILAYAGILSALWRRWLTGRGDRVELSILGAICAVKGQHWTALSNPDDWPGVHLRVWTDPPDYGWQTADRPILFNFGFGRAANADLPPALPAIVAALGGSMPEGMDTGATAGGESSPASPCWKPFWEGLFSSHGWQELREIFAAHGGQVIPFTDYPTLDQHPQQEALGIFVPMSVDGREIRIVRTPWRLDSHPSGFSYEAPAVVETLPS